MKIVYSPNYDMRLMGLEKLHPFDVHKFGKAWNELRSRFGSNLTRWRIDVDRPVTDEELLAVHTAAHLERMRHAADLAKAFEVSWAAMVPFLVLDHGVLQPMRWACRGSVLAALAARDHGLAVNLSGGYHHAKPDQAEGFCIFSDIALLIHQLRMAGRLQNSDTIAYVDLDAHQGNGVCHQFLTDRRVRIFDMFNAEIYPFRDHVARDRIDCAVLLDLGCTGREYLSLLSGRLPAFLDEDGKPALVIYNAGTDVFERDDLGLMSLTADDVLQRDLFVVEQCRLRSIPTVMLLSGGYSSESYRLIADSVSRLIENYGGETVS